MFHTAQFLVSATGIAYGTIKYLLPPPDEFALINHPLQSTMMHWHILFSPSLIFMIGLMWHRHILFYLRSHQKTGRNSGLIMAVTFIPMVISGYALQVSVHEGMKNLFIWMHISMSCFWFFSYIVHIYIQFSGRKSLKSI